MALEEIIEQLRAQLIDAATASQQMASIRAGIKQAASLACKVGMSQFGLGLYQMLVHAASTLVQPSDGAGAIADPGTPFEGDATSINQELKSMVEDIENTFGSHTAIIDWHANSEVVRLLRRDLKRLIRSSEEFDLSESDLDELTGQLVEMASPWRQ